MIDPNKVCLGCMRETAGEEICPYCGFSLKNYEAERNIRILPAATILNGKYLVGKVIGDGGFGITYLALDLNLQVPVAIKEYFPVGLASRDTADGKNETLSLLSGDKERFYKMGLHSFSEEAQSLAKFREVSGVVSVNDFFYENGTAYLVMEYIQGKSLKKYMKECNGTLPEAKVLEIMRPILDALAQIHKQGIIHRDISPENIMLSDSGEVLLIDFGAARTATGAETKSLTVLLKHGYAPVEQYQTKGKQGPWTDIYAVCATMYRMLSGILPDEAVERMVQDNLVPLEKLNRNGDGILVSHHVSAAIQKGLAVRPENRYQNVGKLITDLYGKEACVNTLAHEIDASQVDLSKSESGQNTGEKKEAFIIVPITIVIIAILVFGNIFLTENYEKQDIGSMHAVENVVTHNEKRQSGSFEGAVTPTPTLERILTPTSTPTPIPTPSPTPIPEPEARLVSLSDAVLSNIPLEVVNAEATSVIRQDGVDNSPMQIFDGIESTSWQEGVDGPGIGEKVYAQFDNSYYIEYLTFRLGNWKTNDYYTGNNRPKTLRITLGNDATGTEQIFDVDFPDGKELFCVEINPGIRCSYIEIEIRDIYAGAKWDDTAIADIGFYGAELLDLD